MRIIMNMCFEVGDVEKYILICDEKPVKLECKSITSKKA